MLHYKVDRHPFFPTPSSRYRGQYDEPLPSPVPTLGADSDYKQDPLDSFQPNFAERDLDHGNASVTEGPVADRHFLPFGSERNYHARRFPRSQSNLEPITPMSTITEMSRSTVSLSAVGPVSSPTAQDTPVEQENVFVPSVPATHSSISDSDSGSDCTFGDSDDESDSDETETPVLWEDRNMLAQEYATHASLENGIPNTSSEDSSAAETGPRSIHHLHALVLDAMCQQPVPSKHRTQKQSPTDIPTKHPFASSSPVEQLPTVTSASLPASSASSLLNQRSPLARHKIYNSDSELPKDSPKSEHVSLRSAAHAPTHRVHPNRASTSITQPRAPSPLFSPPFSAPPFPSRHTRAPNTDTFTDPVPTHKVASSHKCSHGHDARTTRLAFDRSCDSARPCCFLEFSDEEERCPRHRVPISFGWLGRRRSSKDSSGQLSSPRHKHPHGNSNARKSRNALPALTRAHTYPELVPRFSPATRRSASAAPAVHRVPANRHERKPSSHYILPPSELAGRKRTLKKPPPLDLTAALYTSAARSPQTHILRNSQSYTLWGARPRDNRDSAIATVMAPRDENNDSDDTATDTDTDTDNLTLDAPFAPSAWCYARDGFSMPAA